MSHQTQAQSSPSGGGAPTDGGSLPERVGPLLYLRGYQVDGVRLSALLVLEAGARIPPLRTQSERVPGECVRCAGGRQVVRYAFTLPARADAWYALDGAHYSVNLAFDGDLRIAFVSCNGQEHGDRQRSLDERNAMWRRLNGQHAAEPFHLLLHGGDQIYADEILDVHPDVRRWASAGGGDMADDDAAVAEALNAAFFRRYLEVLAQPEIGWLMARVPSLAIWDDHDICDGWGSLPEARLDAPVGRRLFEAARTHFLLFQLGAAPDAEPEICPDRAGRSLGWCLELPGVRLAAPDLRSERRPRRVMGPHGWAGLESLLREPAPARVLLLSSVPALGPRLSWVEALLQLTPWMEKYEDDLRDQWQSRGHRAEWRAFLERLAALHHPPETSVTLLSGEIHLATRGTLATPAGPLHQLVASGIAHPPPPTAYARVLGGLAWLGESPLPGRPIRLHPLPGCSRIYANQRNYLILERRDDRWRAWWELEDDGATPALDL